jgi:hypothetical protein
MGLKDRIKNELTRGDETIPQLCKILKEPDEYKLMANIAELMDSGEVHLSGFDKLYREDGGAIYLAKYSRKP